ncbi:acyl-CoA dehydrogenase family protein [Granulicoccus phenolivorans]|uniref:acyl-CoA dehydrogenase family protein n=1 Tax=Granulicoccus phenolivorans TaxID=266854 RepID=UPI0004183086|nr:acyl-CoA dehydrogenase family protein [Granulicoccus phenolivorans]
MTVSTSTPAVLSEEDERDLRRVVRSIADSFGHDYFTRTALADQPATELWNALAEGGFVGANIPEEYGGAGLGLSALAVITEEIAAAGCPLIMLIISPAIVGSVLARHGTDEQKNQWLTQIGTGAGKLSFAITEPDAGLNSHNIATNARREGDNYILNGQKVFISCLDEAEAVLVVARTGTNADTGRAQLSLFIVDADAPGLTMQKMPMVLETPDSQFTVYFDNVVVPADRLVGTEGKGLRAVFDGLNPERVIIAATCTGMARYAMEKGVAYAKEREVWGVPIGAHQGLAHPLAEAAIHLEAARLMIRTAAARYDAGQDAGEASNMAKFLAADAGIECLDQAMEVHGGSAFTREIGLGDMLTLARLFKNVPISREMVLNYVSEHTLGLPKSY